MRLIPVQRNGLPRTKGLVYIEADFRISHEADNMTAQDEMPEGSIAQTGQVADAVQGNWVDRLAPPATRPYLRLSRADRPIGTWLLLLPCWWGLALAILHDGQARLFDLWIFIGCALGAFLMRGAGCTWNDITDRDFDGAVARTRSRPIPSGQVSMKQAAGWMVAQALIALCILLTFNTAAILLGIIALLPVAIYPFAKRFTWWPQVFLGLAFNWGALLAWTAHTGSLGWPAVILYITGIAWTLFYDTIYAHQDTEDDALIGVKSTARLFGQASPQWLTGFMYATTLLMIVAVLAATRAAGAGILPTVVAICGPLAMLVHMRWQMTRFDPTDMPGLLRLFRSNRDAGLLPLLFFAGAALV
jgi:4-hydroxybenzoate polyprenyltransferase